MSEPTDLDFVVIPYPDPVLRRVAEPVTVFDAELRRIVAAMLRRMALSKGVGLAAPQVGLSRRILVANPTSEPEGEIVLVNPAIVARSGPDTFHEEGCLSFPGIYAEVRRPERCVVRAQGLDGQPFEREIEGFLGRIVQHEYDHLEGVLLVDRMSPADKQRHRAALQELVERWQRGAKAPASAR